MKDIGKQLLAATVGGWVRAIGIVSSAAGKGTHMVFLHVSEHVCVNSETRTRRDGAAE